MNVTHQRRMDAGLCTRCGVNPLGTKTLCLGCAAARAEAAREKDQNGLCNRCHMPSDDAFATCSQCRLSMSARYKARKEAGICVQSGCHKPPADHRVRCAEHGEMFARSAKDYRARVSARRTQPDL